MRQGISSNIARDWSEKLHGDYHLLLRGQMNAVNYCTFKFPWFLIPWPMGLLSSPESGVNVRGLGDSINSPKRSSAFGPSSFLIVFFITRYAILEYFHAGISGLATRNAALVPPSLLSSIVTFFGLSFYCNLKTLSKLYITRYSLSYFFVAKMVHGTGGLHSR